MCGIAGFICDRPTLIDPAVGRALLHGLTHRGPDDCGSVTLSEGRLSLHDSLPDFTQPIQAAMFHRRLSILDLSTAGRQPMLTADSQKAIAYNGEIYNYLELRDELPRTGDFAFRTGTDTEVLLRACDQLGDKVHEKLVGMYAYALLDVPGNKLVLARDAFGIKPLFIARWQHGIAFASEIGPLLELPGISRQANSQRVYDYLRYGTTDHAGQTLFADIQQLPIGHHMTIDLGKPTLLDSVRHGSIDPSRRVDVSFEEAASTVRDMFMSNVAMHLRSDVPVGTCLSGGIDSTAIVAAMREIAGKDLEIHSFSYIAEHEAVNEERWVDLASHHAKTIVHKVKPTAQEMAEDLDDLIRVQGEPFGSTSIYAQYRVCRLAKDAGIKVLLDGQGADEMLGGYQPITAARIAGLLRKGRLLAARRVAAGALTSPGSGSSRMMLAAAGLLTPRWLRRTLLPLAGESERPNWMSKDWLDDKELDTASAWGRLGKQTGSTLRDMLFDSFTTHSLPRLLRYEDRNSMAHSIESRVPFLTPDFAQYLFSLPESYLVDNQGTSKSVFRAAMRGIVPDAILDRRDKIGFQTPQREWLVELKPWVERVIESQALSEIRPQNAQAVQSQWRDIQSGKQKMTLTFWRWINLIRWSQQFGVRFD